MSQVEAAKKLMQSWDTKGQCPKCARLFSDCQHSVVDVDDYLGEQVLRAIVRDELRRWSPEPK